MDFQDGQYGENRSSSFWHTNLCACKSNCEKVEWSGICCPWVQTMRNMTRVFPKEYSPGIGLGCQSLCCFNCFEYSVRKQLSFANGLEFSKGSACCISCFCHPCVAWQDAYEINVREELKKTTTFMESV
ncbi:MAG: hypothetical protein EZS28_004355 [Streblomastix strix]|uniref:PLAC8 family protein n=1 Tax=Streblomastix strix TaxID=222440 RepID=A0A5J4WZ25_9EUKA|nr:MAG: hypothetical protein EZS28_004355 [Streblomastix strix]